MLKVTKICKFLVKTTGATSVTRQLLVQTSLQLQQQLVRKRTIEQHMGAYSKPAFLAKNSRRIFTDMLHLYGTRGEY